MSSTDRPASPPKESDVLRTPESPLSDHSAEAFKTGGEEPSPAQHESSGVATPDTSAPRRPLARKPRGSLISFS